jgi:hypothetical protein
MSPTFRTLLIALLFAGVFAYTMLEQKREVHHTSQLSTPFPRDTKLAGTFTITPSPAPLLLTRVPPHTATCTKPLQLRIGQIDSEFNLDSTTLGAALRSATTEWNNATGHTWFNVSNSEGVVVNLLFDGRQEDIEQQRLVEQELDIEITRLKEHQAERAAEALSAEHRIASWNQEKARYDARVATYNSEVTRTEGAQTSDRQVIESLERERNELSMLRQRLEVSAVDMNRAIELTNNKALDTQREGERLAERIETLKRRFPPHLVKEAEHRRGPFVNEINIYTFTDEANLHFALLHELGHAIGLSHSDVSEAIMAPVREVGVSSTRLTPSDIAAARGLCLSR